MKAGFNARVSHLSTLRGAPLHKRIDAADQGKAYFYLVRAYEEGVRDLRR
jgi:hypothetical protein